EGVVAGGAVQVVVALDVGAVVVARAEVQGVVARAADDVVAGDGGAGAVELVVPLAQVDLGRHVAAGRDDVAAGAADAGEAVGATGDAARLVAVVALAEVDRVVAALD